MDASEIVPFEIDDVSSESTDGPAANLTRSKNDAPWKIESPGTSQATLTLKAQKPDSSTWETIVAKSSLMTPLDSRNKKNGNNERVLTPKSSTVVYERIKFICQQPFNKEIAYGLSSVEVIPSASGKTNGLSSGFQLKKKEKNGNIKAGDLFAQSATADQEHGSGVKKEETDEEEDMDETVTAPVKNEDDDHRVEEKDKQSEEEKEKKAPAHKGKKGKPKKKTGSSPSTSKGKKTSKRKKADEDEDVDMDDDDDEEQGSSKKKTRRGAKSQNLKAIMNGCVLALSGFVNPERGDLRDKLLEMGAKYRTDWTDDCTHLICAFPNTPRYNQVRAAGGRIAKKEWILDCYKGKRMIPWRSYMLKPNKQTLADEETEEMEEAKANEDDDWKPGTQDLDEEEEEEEEGEVELSSDEFDLDDEEEYSGSEIASGEDESSGDDRKDRRKKGSKGTKAAPKKSPPKKKVSPKRRGRGVHYDDTDEDLNESDLDLTDTEEDVDKDKGISPRQRPLFRNMHFFLFGEFPDESEGKELEKMIKDLAGTVREYNDEDVTHCVTPQKWNPEFDQAISENPHLIFVTPQWIYECQKHRTLLDPRKYKPKSAS